MWAWKWSCDGAGQPPLALDTTTLCVGCNGAVSIRVGSPGDSGDITQSTQVLPAAEAGSLAQTTQTAAQIRPPTPPAAPTPPVSAPPDTGAAPPPEAAAAAPPDPPESTASDAPAELVATEAPVPVAGLANPAEAEPLPLHGAVRYTPVQAVGGHLPRHPVSTATALRRIARLAAPFGGGGRYVDAQRRRVSTPARAPHRPRRDVPGRAPAAPPIPVPSFPTLSSTGSAHGTGGALVGVGLAVAAAAAAALDLLRRVVTAPTPVRGQRSGKRPDPPG